MRDRQKAKRGKEGRRFFFPPARFRTQDLAESPVALSHFAEVDIHFSQDRLLAERGKHTRTLHKSAEVTAKSFVHLLSLAVINSLHLGNGQRP